MSEKQNVISQIQAVGIVPVVKLDSPEQALPLAKALAAGDMPVAEITFRTAAAEESIRIVSREMPEMLVGAGTVLSVDQAKKAVAAGAKFIVAPGLNPNVVQYCVDNGVSVTPGVNNPSQIEQALGFGLNVVKFFPAEQSGGLAMIKALAGPFGNVRFMPTGGIDAKNMASYLAYEKILAIGGSWMVKPELIAAGKYAEITRLAREAVLTGLGFSLVHLGVNMSDEETTMRETRRMADLFGFPHLPGNSSVFVGTGWEFMKTGGRGKMGHIAMGTLSVERAAAYLGRRGIKTIPETERKKGDVVTIVYTDYEVGGFAVHLFRK